MGKGAWPDGLSLITKSHMMEGKTKLWKLVCLLLHLLWHTWLYKEQNYNDIKFNQSVSSYFLSYLHS